MAGSWVEAIFGDSARQGSGVGSKDPIRLEFLPVEELVADLSHRTSSKSVEDLLAERLKKAYQNGFDDGAKEGEDLARRSFLHLEEELKERLRQLGSMISELESMVARGYEAKVSDLASFAFEIAKSVMHMEPDLEQKRLEIVLTEALQEVPVGREVAIRVNPTMLSFVTEVLNGKEFGRSSTFKVVSDATVEPGGVVVEEGPTTLDLQLKTATDRIKEVLDELSGVRD